MNTIFAFMILMLPGMNEPKVMRNQVPTIEACAGEIGKMLALVKEHETETAKVAVGCEISTSKSDPS